MFHINFKPRKYILNEVQYRKMFLSERLHYPKYMEKLFKEVFDEAKTYINNFLEDRTDREHIIVLENNIYFDSLKLIIKNFQSVSDRIVAEYNNTQGNFDSISEKLIEPTITVYIPDSLTECNDIELYSDLSHELTHLFDDYISCRQGNGSINFNKNTETIPKLMNSYNNLLKNIGKLLYLSFYAGKKAFVTQSYNEFKKVGCTPENYKDKYKETIPYKNYKKLSTTIKNEILNSEDYELKILNNEVNSKYKNTIIPRVDINKFNPDDYRRILSQFIDKQFHNFMKKFGGILTCYLEDFSTEQML